MLEIEDSFLSKNLNQLEFTPEYAIRVDYKGRFYCWIIIKEHLGRFSWIVNKLIEKDNTTPGKTFFCKGDYPYETILDAISSAKKKVLNLLLSEQRND